MNTTDTHHHRLSRVAVTDFRSPHYECREVNQAMMLTVFVPGVEAGGVEICLRGPDLIVTAAKKHVVRVNFRAAHLEAAQKDYQLCLRVGYGFDASRLHADMESGILTLTLPKKARGAYHAVSPEHQKVA